MATTLSRFPQPSLPSNSWLPLSDACVSMAETTMASADLVPVERPMPVGYRFRPTDQELVGHYLRHKLKADDLSIHDTIPEIGVCKHEPWDLLNRAASASAAKFDESQCFFFSPRDYKYSNSTRSNRTTLRGFWKVTGRDRKITSKGTNKVIGTKKTLTYYGGRVPHEIKTNWVIHEYHDAQLSHSQRTHVLCWLRKDNKKKTEEKIHQLVDDERSTINPVIFYENQANVCMNSEEHYFSNRSLMIQVSSQSTEATESMIQVSSQSNEATESMIQVSSQLNEATESMIQVSSQSNEGQVPSQPNKGTESMIQVPSQPNEVIESMIQVTFQSNQAIVSMIQIPFESNQAVDPTKQISPQSFEAIGSMIQTPFKSNEELASIFHIPPSESNSTIAVDSMIQTPFKADEELASIIHTPPPESNSTIAVDSMFQTPFKTDEELASVIYTPPHESNSTTTLDSMMQTFIIPTIQPDETLTSMFHILPPEPNSIVETSFDAGEFGFSLFDSGESDFTSLLQSPRIDEQGLFEMMATSDMRWHQA